MTASAEAGEADPPARSTGWVARRLGVSPSTLRTWQRRYGVGPTGRTSGGHGRYRGQDLDRLERMHGLIVAGVPTAEAARASADPRTAPPVPPHRIVARRTGGAGGARGAALLARAAERMDQPAVDRLLTAALARDGVVATWDELVVPVLVGIGDHYARHGGRIEVEHLFSDRVRAALAAAPGSADRSGGPSPVLLACPDQELHSLGLDALAAALGEAGCPARVLGASAPAAAIIAAIRLVGPRAVFLWSQAPATARVEDLPVPGRRLVPVVVGGPGWRDRVLPPAVTRVDSLTSAVAAVTGVPAVPVG